METMAGRVAVVTGAASGIGRALALGFADEGANVVLADVEEEPLAAAADEVSAVGVEALPVRTDVTDAESMEALAAATIERFGTVNKLSNNAGVGPSPLVTHYGSTDLFACILAAQTQCVQGCMETTTAMTRTEF